MDEEQEKDRHRRRPHCRMTRRKTVVQRASLSRPEHGLVRQERLVVEAGGQPEGRAAARIPLLSGSGSPGDPASGDESCGVCGRNVEPPITEEDFWCAA